MIRLLSLATESTTSDNRSMTRLLSGVVVLALSVVGCFSGSTVVHIDHLRGIWILESFETENTRQMVEIGVNAVGTPWIEIGTSINGFTGCNDLDSFEGSRLEVDEGHLLPGEWLTTAAECRSDTTDLMAAETAIHSALMEGRIAVEVSADRMTWMTAVTKLVWVRTETVPSR